MSIVSPQHSLPPLTVKATIVSSQDINTHRTIGRPVLVSPYTNNLSSTTPAGYLLTVSGHFKDRAPARVFNNGEAAAAHWHWDRLSHAAYGHRLDVYFHLT